MGAMNDPELSRLLREWQVEDAPRKLDARVLGIVRPRWGVRIGRGMLAAATGARRGLLLVAVTGLGAFLIVVTEAIPQTLKLLSPPPPPPYTVDSGYFRYTDDGSRRVEMFSTSYTDANGKEVLLGRTLPDRPLETSLGRTLDTVLPLIRPLTRSTNVSPEMEQRRFAAAVKNVDVITGCNDWTCLVVGHWFFARAETGAAAPCAAGRVKGEETILGYRTVAVERPIPNPTATANRPAGARRITTWMAPDLGCFALKLTIEEQRPDGSFGKVSEKQALRMTVTP